MKKTKLTALIASLALTSSMVTGFSANAVYISFPVSRFDEYVSGLNAVEIEDTQWLGIKDDFNRVLDYTACYFKSGGNSVKLFCFYEENALFYITPDSNADSSEICNMIEELDESYKTVQFSDGDISVRTKDENGKEKGLTPSEAKELCVLLKDKAEEFYYHPDYIGCYAPKYFDNMMRYMLDEDEVENLRNYIAESGINAEIVSTNGDNLSPFGNFKIVPDEELTAMEYYELAKEIFENVGITPSYTVQESMNPISESVELDLNDFINGDANEDGKRSMADATFVLQHIGNPEKYQLSAQGEFNADVDGNAGITGEDALTIQMMEVGLV